jgi:hypothetical protein
MLHNNVYEIMPENTGQLSAAELCQEMVLKSQVDFGRLCAFSQKSTTPKPRIFLHVER